MVISQGLTKSIKCFNEGIWSNETILTCSDSSGPSNWRGTCSTGKEQSPIALPRWDSFMNSFQIILNQEKRSAGEVWRFKLPSLSHSNGAGLAAKQWENIAGISKTNMKEHLKTPLNQDWCFPLESRGCCLYNWWRIGRKIPAVHNTSSLGSRCFTFRYWTLWGIFRVEWWF